MRRGVNGSALPGFRINGVLRAMEGAHSECTPGELLGRTTPSDDPRAVKLYNLARETGTFGNYSRLLLRTAELAGEKAGDPPLVLVEGCHGFVDVARVPTRPRVGLVHGQR